MKDGNTKDGVLDMIDADAIKSYADKEGFEVALSDPTSTRQIAFNTNHELLKVHNCFYFQMGQNSNEWHHCGDYFFQKFNLTIFFLYNTKQYCIILPSKV